MKIFEFLSLFLFVITIFLVSNKAFSQIEFIENKGQWDSRVKFMSNAGNGAIFLERKGFTVLQHNQKDLERILDKLHTNKLQQKETRFNTLNSHAYDVEFVNANPSA